ncbi:MAG: MBL fold metallo-hydrolase, partial [Gammaproteobacteria bacterium]|nr:MBL fold metallo-hydrolase [Gammaproteobacteria bacterium]
MLVRFWGTRGSLPKPGPDTIRYGGNTSCVEIRSASGTLIVIDCGSGAHNLGRKLGEADQPTRGHLLISHTHWDHIQGIPFFTPLFTPGNEWDIYAPNSLNQSIRETLAGQMQYTYFPVTLDALGADIRYHDLVEGTFQIDDITVTTQYLHHTVLTLGYRIEVDGRTVIYACDHEPFPRQPDSVALNEQDMLHVDFLQDADLVIHDAQYTEEEYPQKLGWGHSTAEYAVDVCCAAGVRQLALTHHDPMRNDDDVDQVVSAMRNRLSANRQPLQVFAAAEGQKIELKPTARPVSEKKNNQRAKHQHGSALAEYPILLAPTSDDNLDILAKAAAAEKIRLIPAKSMDDGLQILENQRLSLVIVDEDHCVDDALEVA